ncbi:MAG: carboxylating nicotinate-nucleotide diphosphorylase [Candidatus Omnitrophica bacterium]|nr:carboxylating nicotinate-nucleotide diphosphorylase [Candidatus Omnitrophota bacterium]
MIDKEKLKKFVKEALAEDIGKIDLTTTYLIPSRAMVKADIIAKSGGVVCGLPLIESVYAFLDSDIKIKFNVKEGAVVEPGKAVSYLEGQATSILKGERLVLNLLGRASSIATFTKAYVDKVRPYNVQIFDTRKTTPNMRFIEKYAVRTGGGKNHRMGLYDQVLVKDNHLAVLKELGGTKDSMMQDMIRSLRKRVQKNIKIEVEVNSIAEFEDALSAGPDIIMLDNMSPDEIAEAVKIRDASTSRTRRVIIEASGNIRLDNIEEYAKTKVDRISVGAITHSPPALDFSLDII